MILSSRWGARPGGAGGEQGGAGIAEADGDGGEIEVAGAGGGGLGEVEHVLTGELTAGIVGGSDIAGIGDAVGEAEKGGLVGGQGVVDLGSGPRVAGAFGFRMGRIDAGAVGILGGVETAGRGRELVRT